MKLQENKMDTNGQSYIAVSFQDTTVHSYLSLLPSDFHTFLFDRRRVFPYLIALVV